MLGARQAAHGLDVRMLLVLLAPVLAWCIVSR